MLSKSLHGKSIEISKKVCTVNGVGVTNANYQAKREWKCNKTFECEQF